MDSVTRVSINDDNILNKVGVGGGNKFKIKFKIFLSDVMGSAKGWAASLLFHPNLKAQFKAFAGRNDTFSLGVCNGCQLMSLLGWIGIRSQDGKEEKKKKIFFIYTKSHKNLRFFCCCCCC